MSQPFVELRSVTKAFGDLEPVSSVDLSVWQGERVAVLGPSGTGKSVLLKLISGLMAADSGEVMLWGRNVEQLTAADWRAIRKRMGLVFQTGALFDSMSVFENVAYPMREFRRSKEEIASVVPELLDLVGLAGTGDKAPSELSGGMRKRVALARTLSIRPELVLYDEPTAGLDPVSGRRISHLIHELSDRFGATVLAVTHDIDCARLVADRWVLLSDGRIVVDGTPAELFRSTEPEVQRFLDPWTALVGEHRIDAITTGDEGRGVS